MSGHRAIAFVVLLAAAQLSGQPDELHSRQANESLRITLQDPPATISASGLYSDMARRVVSPGIIPYTVAAELWADGAHKERFLAVPGLQQIEFAADGPWGFPAATVLVKNFSIETVAGDPSSLQLVETRFLVKRDDGSGWGGLSYKWADDGSDAFLQEKETTGAYFVLDPEAADGLREHEHYFPNRAQCDQCHVQPAGVVLGVRTEQLNHDHGDDVVIVNQLRSLNDMGLFTRDIGPLLPALRRMADPFDDSAPLAARARSYLAANCSHCHRPGVIDKADIDLRWETSLAATGIVDRVPTLASFDGLDVRILRPGDGLQSSLYLRMLATDSNRMPPLATHVVDDAGARLVRRWIDGLKVPTAVALDAQSARWRPSRLRDIAPNPFNSVARIHYEITRPGPVSVTLFDVLGRRLQTLVDADHDAGLYHVPWDGRDSAGQPAASGVYFCRLWAADGNDMRRLTLLR